MNKFTKRQLNILEFIRQRGSASNKEIKDHLRGISRVTVVRDLKALLRAKLIIPKGKGRGLRYVEEIKNDILQYIDVDEYFKKSPDERSVKSPHFNFEVFKKLNNLFTGNELDELNNLVENYRKRVKKLSPVILKKEFERLMIELSWKSSQIEGNTYSLLDTEILIKEHKEAKGHEKEEAIMILNHKKALDYIMDKKSGFKNITLRKIENIQRLLIKDLSISHGLRRKPVGIVGTKYKPLDNEYQIREALEKMTRTIRGSEDIFSKAILAIILISYIQPFEDGNKRTARLAGNALLLAHDACPLSFRSVNEVDYKKALVLFYEQNNIRFFKELFVEQFKFAITNYFQ